MTLQKETTLLSDNDADSAVITTARRWCLGGRVQGVGFRPFVYRLARAHGLYGWVINHSGQVEILAQGETPALDNFAIALIDQAPSVALPLVLDCRPAALRPLTQFSIRHDSRPSAGGIHVMPDISLCASCRRELLNPADRRYRYPFINCSECGPRYSIITRLPYDRDNTAMQPFHLCQPCQFEYDNAADRRFHAQTIACPQCGPALSFVHADTVILNDNAAALAACVTALHQGAIVAIKGIGGYHLACDAANDAAVARLRHHKQRADKPLAIMLPLSLALTGLERFVAADPLQTACLFAPLAPIVLAAKNPDAPLSALLSPGLDEIGIMLPYSPLHQLLLEDFAAPLVMTSANRSGAPVCIDTIEAQQQLDPMADAFLHHNRTIVRPADDPVLRCIAGRARPLRLGRGNAPLELTLPMTLAQPLLAVGGQQKNTIALAWQNRIVISAHIGDLSHPRSLDLFKQQIEDLQSLYQIRPAHVICDSHPDYSSSRWAMASGNSVIRVRHHHAHAAAVAGEHPAVSRWLVFTWDGSGLGEDNAVWGGEALLGSPGHWQRRASLRPFHIPATDRAAREPWRCAAVLAWESGTEWRACPHDDTLLQQAWQRRINSPPCTSVGRLFDAAAALLGLVDNSSYEAQAAMQLESSARTYSGQYRPDDSALPGVNNHHGIYESDWAALLPMLLNQDLAVAERAAHFHQTLAHTLLDQALTLRQAHGEFTVGLSGGVFQNRYLTETAVALLQQHGFDVRLGEQIPANDAGLSYGQIIEAAAAIPVS